MRENERFSYNYIKIRNRIQFLAISKDINSNNNPIILFLHGGPGMTVSHLLDKLFLEFDNKFNVVVWDQLGAGLSYRDEIDSSEMTLETVIEYTKEIIEYIKYKYNNRKIILMGHSFGGTLALFTLNKYPDICDKLICISPWMIEDNLLYKKEIIKKINIIAKTNNDVKENKENIINEFCETGFWPDQYLIKYSYDSKSKYTDWEYQENLVKESKLYSKEDISKYFKGMNLSEYLYQDVITKYSVIRDIKNLNCEILFFVGERDLITPSIFLDDFLNNVNIKNYKIIKTDTNHYIFLDNPELFFRVFKENNLI